jgi:2,3-bisphosphoglycerate-independent phosphoglycerate mutase
MSEEELCPDCFKVVGERSRYNLVCMLWNKYPHSLLQASGLAVGLPEGQIGDSNVGHLTIGSGRPIDTYLVRINKAIENGDFSKSQPLNSLIDYTKKHDSTVHVMGLVSPGGVHSHEEHLFAEHIFYRC